MRHAFAFAFCLLLGCSPEVVARPPAPPVDWASLNASSVPHVGGPVKATLRERATTGVYLAALSAPSFADLGAVLDDDAHFAFAGFRDVHGRDSVVRAHESLFGAFDSRNVAASRILLTDGSQAIEWTLSGVEHATEKPVAFRGLTLLWTKDDGTITDVHVYFDQAVVAAELGKGPKTLAGLPPPPLPAGPPAAFEQQGTLDEHDGVAFVQSALDALEANDDATYVGKMADDLELVTLESAEPQRGKAAARAYFKAMHRAITHLDSVTDDVWGIGPYVVVEYHVVGEQSGPLGFVPAQKDNLVKLFAVDVVELRAGKIAHIVRYDNPSQLLVGSP